jgi:hypothetical protein
MLSWCAEWGGCRQAMSARFPQANQLVALANSVSPMTSLKPHRLCESYWAHRGVNVRSTLWNEPRGGAPLTAACLPLTAWTGLPCWPWWRHSPMLVEAFPAAQLRHSTQEVRRDIVNAFARRLSVPTPHRYQMLESPGHPEGCPAAQSQKRNGPWRLVLGKP